MTKKIAITVSLILFTLVIVLPVFIYGYVYPNSGDDFAYHLTQLKSGAYWSQLYYAYVTVGYPMEWLNVLGVSYLTSFFWFNVIGLLCIGYSVFIVMTKLVNYRVGILGLASILLANGIWSQYYFGEIFAIINIGIIFVWLVYFIIRWYEQHKLYQLILVFLLTLIMSYYHTNGIYLVPLYIGLLAFYIIYTKARKLNFSKAILCGLISLSTISLLCAYLMSVKATQVWSEAYVYTPQLPIPIVIITISPVVMAVVIFTLVFNKIKISLLLVILCIMAFALFVAMVGVSPHPDRQLYDFATIFGLIMAVLLGSVLKEKKFNYILVAVVVIGIIINLPNWVNYNSTIKPVDKQAIAYLNSVDAETFSTGLNVTPEVYWHYIDLSYEKDGGDILLTRSEPLTLKSDETSISYSPRWKTTTDGYQVSKVFSDNDITVLIWEKIDELH
jgi:hypothetical protein